MLQNGDNTIDGVLVVVTYNSNTNFTQLVFPEFKDDFGNPMTVFFNPGVPNDTAQAVINAIIAAQS